MRWFAGIPWIPVAGVLAVIVALTLGFSLANAALPNDAALAPDTVLRLDTPEGHATTTLPGPGWEIRRAESNPNTDFQVAIGRVAVTIFLVTLLSPDQANNLWTGQDSLSRLDGTNFGQPEPITSDNGVTGQTAPLRSGSAEGSLTFYLPPDRSFAIRMTVLASPAANDQDVLAADVAVRSLALTGS